MRVLTVGEPYQCTNVAAQDMVRERIVDFIAPMRLGDAKGHAIRLSDAVPGTRGSRYKG